MGGAMATSSPVKIGSQTALVRSSNTRTLFSNRRDFWNIQ